MHDVTLTGMEKAADTLESLVSVETLEILQARLAERYPMACRMIDSYRQVPVEAAILAVGIGLLIALEESNKTALCDLRVADYVKLLNQEQDMDDLEIEMGYQSVIDHFPNIVPLIKNEALVGAKYLATEDTERVYAVVATTVCRVLRLLEVANG